MIVYTVSEKTNIQKTEHVDSINIFCQFFVHPNSERHNEIKTCLQNNVKNKYITKIYLLNEKIYTEEELGVSSEKIIQIDIKKRLKFQDVFEYINNNNIKGYNAIINSDIFFKKSIKNLFKSDIHINKKMYALLRYEYDVSKPDEPAKLFGHRGDSQDTWIIHSNFSVGKKESKIFNFEFGKPGCDNKMIYLMSVLGYKVINDPEYIKTFHIHTSNIRGYTSDDRVQKPYEILTPKSSFELSQEYYQFDINIIFNKKYHHKYGNLKLYNYITGKINENKNFVIPRGSTVETQCAIFALLLLVPTYKEQYSQITEILESIKPTMKNNAGIKVSNIESMKKYSKMYLNAFENCELYGGWAPFDAVYNSVGNTYVLLNEIFKHKDMFYSEALDIFHFIYSVPWTHALKNKRLLFVSQFKDSIDKKIDIRKNIYGVDLFPGCEILTIKPPQTQAGEESEEFDIEFDKFAKELDKIKNDYDIALVSCGGYGSLVCSHIFNSGKSAIYVGGVLQMYWGILGARWFNDRPDIIRLFLNGHWSKPLESEKPANFSNVEKGCYWC